MQLTLHAYAVMISHWCERETPWRVPYTTTDHNNASALARPPRPQRISILQQFRAALDNFRSGRPQHGGNLLRQAFLNIERAVLETAQAALDMEAVWDCCLAIPQLILQSTEAWTDPDGLLPIFANHFYQLCKLKLANNNIHHPLTRIAETLRRLCHPSRAGDDKMMMHRPQLWLYIRRAWHLWLDRVTRVRGRQDEMAIHLRRGYVTLMIPVDAYGDNSTTTGSDMAQAHNLIGDFCEAVQRSLATRGSFATTARILELERLLCRMYLPLFTDESAARANNMLVGVVERVQGKHKHEDEGNGGRANMAEWHFLDRYLVFSANYFLSCIAEYSGERDLAVEYRRRSLDAPRDLFWLQTTMVLEEELRLMGYQEEANAVMEERMKEQEMYVTTSLEGNQLLLPGLQVGEKREGV
ncbi:hypothetical protein N656DRAFT_773517 [Canariomyces notabilis]|uniref:Uncharacterized protein n=1 Tax=Canariomyces notabilis TaxID=2074819 RepID=A0AAN6TMX6_9PEZI|nr:hypothetical protein N656DRAFT_773517 [Canariomyces arenarius]